MGGRADSEVWRVEPGHEVQHGDHLDRVDRRGGDEDVHLEDQPQQHQNQEHGGDNGIVETSDLHFLPNGVQISKVVTKGFQSAHNIEFYERVDEDGNAKTLQIDGFRPCRNIKMSN